MTINTYIIPTISSQQSFSISLAGVPYTMRLIYCDDPQAGWILDIGDVNGAPLLCGIPLVLNIDLLQQYEYLNIGGRLIALAGNEDSIGFNDLGTTAQLYFVTETI